LRGTTKRSRRFTVDFKCERIVKLYNVFNDTFFWLVDTLGTHYAFNDRQRKDVQRIRSRPYLSLNGYSLTLIHVESTMEIGAQYHTNLVQLFHFEGLEWVILDITYTTVYHKNCRSLSFFAWRFFLTTGTGSISAIDILFPARISRLQSIELTLFPIFQTLRDRDNEIEHLKSTLRHVRNTSEQVSLQLYQ